MEYSITTAKLSFVFSIYGMLELYFRNIYLWVPIGFAVVLLFDPIFFGKIISNNNKLIYYNVSKLKKLFIKLILLAYYSSTIYALIRIAIVIPVKAKSLLILPFISISLIFAGTTIGLYYFIISDEFY